MKTLKAIIGIAIITMTITLLTGCGTVTKSTKEKSVNLEMTVYGFKVTGSDATANGSPTGSMGFGSIRYRSFPVDRGQPFYVSEAIGSLWGNATKTTIWIGRAAEKSVLTFEAVPSGMIKISGEGIKTGETTVSVTPEASEADTTTTTTNQPEEEQKEE